MYLESKLVPAEDLAIFGYPGNQGERVRIFEGVMVRVGEEVGLSRSAVTAGASLLLAMQATTTLRKTTPRVPGVILMSYRPSQEQFEEFRDNTSLLSRRITPNKYEEMRAKIEDLLYRVAELEKKHRAVSEALTRIHDKQMLGGF
jgi:hypothetical protein